MTKPNRYIYQLNFLNYFTRISGLGCGFRFHMPIGAHQFEITYDASTLPEIDAPVCDDFEVIMGTDSGEI